MSLEPRCIAEEACNNPDDGANAGSGPTEETSSGFGGLGLEGIVGMVDPGEGKSGATSGDNSVYGDNGGSGSTVGAAAIVGVCNFGLGVEDKDSEGENDKATMSATRMEKLAIIWSGNGINQSIPPPPLVGESSVAKECGRNEERIVGEMSIYDGCYDYYNFVIMTNDQCGLVGCL